MQYIYNMSDIQESISRAIAVQLARMGKNQAWLANQMDVSGAWVSNRMTGRTPFNTDDLAKVGSHLGLGPFEIFHLAEMEACAVA